MNRYHPSPADARPREIELIRSMIRGTATKKQEKELEKLLPTPPDTRDAFILKSAGDWLAEIASQAPPAMLFGEFWHEGELSFLFADTNAGKSILSVQLAEAIARGEPIPGFAMPRKPQNVLYFDFELSAAQFGSRYTSEQYGPYRFAPHFYRIVLNPKATGEHKFANFADYLENALANMLITSHARIVIIDNISCLRTGTEAAAGAIRLMRSLRTLKERLGLSILVLAHTPKRDAARPITRNDLQGSKMLLNFADSAFAIGESHTHSGLRYLKQIKQRSTQEEYGAKNVCLCRIVKPMNFLQFKFEGNGRESQHLLSYQQQQRRDTETHLLTLRSQGHSLNQISAKTGIPRTTVSRMLMKMLKEEEEEKGAVPNNEAQTT